MVKLIWVCLLGGLWEIEATLVTGVLGETITISCSHVNAFSNVKYFCKGTCGKEDLLISSKQSKTDSNEKYTIRDEGNTFYVTISRLTEDDSGTYWCGVDRFALDTYNKVVLTVIKGSEKEPDKDFPESTANKEMNTKASSSNKLVYIGAGLGVVVLALATVLLIFFRYRSRNISEHSGNVHEMVYATPRCVKRDACDITTSSLTSNEDHVALELTESIFSSSSAQHQGASRDHTDNIYSNVTVSSDSLFYSTVSCSNKDCSTVIPRTAGVTYSTINYISTDESNSLM